MRQIEIRIKGHIDEIWSAWFDGLAVEHLQPDITILTGEVIDQSALYGLIAKLRDLGLSLIALKTFSAESDPKTEKNTGE